MKQTMFVSVLALILVSVIGGDISSKSRPDNFGELIKPSGDDHPWGGEQLAPPDPLKSSDWDHLGATGFALIDYLFLTFIDSYVADQIEQGMKTGAESVRIDLSSEPVVSNETVQQDNMIGR